MTSKSILVRAIGQKYSTKMSRPKEAKQEEISLKEFLVERVKHYRAIWDTTSKEYHQGNVRTNCWLEIAKELKEEFPAELLKRHGLENLEKLKEMWQNMRNIYRKNKRNTVGKSGAAAADVTPHQSVKWPFFTQMGFLDDTIKATTTVASLTLAAVAEERSTTITNEQVRGNDL